MTGMGSCKPAGKGKVGEVLINKENIITFKEGLLGFEDLREFVILDIEEWRPFEWLVSVENPDVTFPIVNPAPFFKDYYPAQQIQDVSAIGAKDQKGVEMFCIVTLGKKPEDATVNLKGPIFVNTQNKAGKQYVLEGKQYTLNHPFVKKPAGTGKDCCGSGGTSVSNPKLGEVLIKKENIITFKDGLLGFEDLREFVILSIEEWRPFEWLVSVENPDVTFPIVNPTPFFNDYHPLKQIEDVSAIGAKDKKGLEVFCTVTLGINPENATVNLKGPILINTQNKSGKQYVLEGVFSLNHPFVKTPGGKSCCGSDSIKVSSSKLGELLVKKENIITFKAGLMGFEELRDFVLLDIEEWRPFEWLVSVENPDVTFPVVNPKPFFTDYNPAQQLKDISAIGVKDTKSAEVLCTVTLGNKPENATVNLKGPILINSQSRTGKQYVMEGKQYTQSHPFVKKPGRK